MMRYVLAGIVLSALTTAASSNEVARLDVEPDFEEMGYREAADWLFNIVEGLYPRYYGFSWDGGCYFLAKYRQRILETGPPEQGGRLVHEWDVEIEDLDSCNDEDRRIVITTVIHLANARVMDAEEYYAYRYGEVERIHVPKNHDARMLVCTNKVEPYLEHRADLGCIEGSYKRYRKGKEETSWELRNEFDLSRRNSHPYMPRLVVRDERQTDMTRIESALNRLIELARPAREK